MRPFPDAARIEVPRTLASDLLAAARALPARETEAYYDGDLQQCVLDKLRGHCAGGFDWLVEEIRLRLARAPFSAAVTGLEFDAENRLFIGLSRAFGRLVSRPLKKPRAQLVHYLHHHADLTSSQSGQVYTELLHTDGADWPEQIDVIGMVCVRPDDQGEGRSRLVDMYTICREIRERFGPEVLQVLEDEPVPWLLAPGFDAEVVWRPVLGRDRMCWRRYTIDFALARPGIEISAHAAHALDAVEAVTSTTTSTHEWLMRPGEFVLLDNRKCMHARTAISRRRPSRRLMVRAWVRTRGEDPAGLRPC